MAIAMESCLKLEALKKAGYKNVKDWIKTPGNVYTGGRFSYKLLQFTASKWQNPFASNPDIKTSLLLYVNYLFRSDLIYDIDELIGKNLGCFCHNVREKWSEPMCHNQVLVDMINRCYEPIEKLIQNKKELLSSTTRLPIFPSQIKTGLITLTFGDAAENHVGMEKIGNTLKPGQGFDLSDLEKMRKNMKSLGVNCMFVNLTESLEDIPSLPSKPEAYVLVMKGAVNKILEAAGKGLTQNDMFDEQTSLLYDKYAYMYGRVVQKVARWNLCFDDKSRSPDYDNGKGRIIGYNEVPLMKKVKEQFPYLFGEKADDLKVESNYYYDHTKCGIGWHGDSERVKVIAMRLGHYSTPIHFQWYYRGKSIGKRISIPLDPGDIYVMTEKAVGTDWRKKVIPTLRHATGCDKFLRIN